MADSAPLLSEPKKPIMSNDTNDKTPIEIHEANKDDNEERNPLISIIIALVIIAANIGVAFATNTYYECGISLGINLLSFICFAWPFHTEKYYDLTGMITFLACDTFSILYHQVPFNVNYIRNFVLFAMVMMWTLRLGLFLFKRISTKHGGKDQRFDNLRDNFSSFLIAWLLQSTWVYFCCMPLFITNQIHNENVYRTAQNKYTVLDIIGWCLWLIGWGIEIIADRQKTVFKNDVNNKGKFCNAGLWKYSRHPNYFGEITLWFGIFLSAASIAKNEGWMIALSPIWTVILLVFTSGIPLAERTAMKKYGQQDEYQQYVKTVSVLIPLPCCWKGYI